MRKIGITAVQLGSSDVVDIRIGVDKTYVPAVNNGVSCDRGSSAWVFHAFIQPTTAPVPATH